MATGIIGLPPNVPGAIVEAGCFKGGSTAKLSIVAKMTNRKLIVFDSFEGIPSNEEPHKTNIFGGRAGFRQGSYKGELEEVKANVKSCGFIEQCEFIKGWFEDTMPTKKIECAAVYLDVDLVSSTSTCLENLYPSLSQGGILYSQDGHLPLVIELFDNDEFWRDRLNIPKPEVKGLRKSKLISIIKN